MDIVVPITRIWCASKYAHAERAVFPEDCNANRPEISVMLTPLKIQSLNSLGCFPTKLCSKHGEDIEILAPRAEVVTFVETEQLKQLDTFRTKRPSPGTRYIGPWARTCADGVPDSAAFQAEICLVHAGADNRVNGSGYPKTSNLDESSR